MFPLILTVSDSDFVILSLVGGVKQCFLLILTVSQNDFVVLFLAGWAKAMYIPLMLKDSHGGLVILCLSPKEIRRIQRVG